MRTIFLILILSLFAKLLLGALLPMTPDEAYYWIWSQKLQLSYYDHPPAIAWLFYIGNFLPSFMIKWPAIVLNHSGLLGFCFFLKQLNFNEKEISRWIYLALATPLVGMAGVIMTPDLALLAFVPWASLFFIKSLNEEKLFNYLIFGIFLGLGMLSKYHAVLFVIGLLIYLFLDQNARLKLNWLGFVIAVLSSVLVFSPVILWNATHNWASFTFQAKHGFEKKNWSPSLPISYFLGQLILITPFFWPKLVSIFKNSHKMIRILSILPLGFFLISSLRAPVELNWTNLAFPFLCASFVSLNQWDWRHKSYVAFWTVLLGLIISHWLYPWLPTDNHKLNEPILYKPVQEVAKTYQPFYAGSYQMASIVSWNQKKVIYKLPGIRRRDFFDTLKTEMDLEPTFYLVKESWVDFPEYAIKDYQRELIKNLTTDFELWKLIKK